MARQMNANSLKNLKPTPHHLTHEQIVEAAKKGGIASGIARRQRKEMRETIQEIFEMGVRNGKVTEEFKSLEDAKGKNLTVAQTLVLAQIKKAMSGDTRALEFLRDTAGEKPVDRQEIVADVKTSPLQGILDQLQEDDSEE